LDLFKKEPAPVAQLFSKELSAQNQKVQLKDEEDVIWSPPMKEGLDTDAKEKWLESQYLLLRSKFKMLKVHQHEHEVRKLQLEAKDLEIAAANKHIEAQTLQQHRNVEELSKQLDEAKQTIAFLESDLAKKIKILEEKEKLVQDKTKQLEENEKQLKSLVFDCNAMLKHMNDNLDGVMLEISVNNILKMASIYPNEEPQNSKNEENEAQVLQVIKEDSSGDCIRSLPVNGPPSLPLV